MTIEGIKSQMEHAGQMTYEDLLNTYYETAAQLIETITALNFARKSEADMSDQFQQLQMAFDGFKADNERLQKQVASLQKASSESNQNKQDAEDELHASQNSQFGRSSEQADGLHGNDGTEPSDPTDESANPDQTDTSDKGNAGNTSDTGNAGNSGNTGDSENTNAHNNPKKFFGSKTPKRKKTKDQAKQKMGNLPVVNDLTVTEPWLIEHFGTDFEIFSWESHYSYEYIPAKVIIHRRWTPILAKGIDRELIRLQHPAYLLPNSRLSASFAAGIAYEKFKLHEPLYRQEQNLNSFDVDISRQTMSYDLNKLADLYLYPIWVYFLERLNQEHHIQSDETYTQAIEDGRAKGSKSFYWVHTTSELTTGPRIILYCFELTRSAEHLRRLFGKKYSGEMMDDAYCAYFTFEKDSDGKVHISVCFAHARRRFVIAFIVRHLEGMSDEEIGKLPEVKAIRMLMKIYAAENPLRNLTPEQRFEGRQKKVKPLVDEYFEFVRSLDPEDPTNGKYLNSAISYSQKYEKQLRRFLDDPMIPIDNLYVERQIKPVALGRRNYMFSFSPEGGEANAMYYTMVQTATENGAHPYYYLKYLFTRMPDLVSQPTCKALSPEVLKTLTPWSAEYKEYEAREKKKDLHPPVPNEDTFRLPKWKGGRFVYEDDKEKVDPPTEPEPTQKSA